MKLTIRVLFLGFCILINSACNSVSPTANVPNGSAFTPISNTKDNPGTGAYLLMDEIGVGPKGYVSLTNFTDQPASLAGLYLCQGSNCFKLPDAMVNEGETVRIAVGDGTGLEGVVATHATLGVLNPSDGEIALLNSSDPNDPNAILIYYQWGSTPHKLTQIAIDSGLWIQGGYGPSSPNATRLFKVPETGLWIFDEP
jgi:hypothetical protein